MTTNRMTRAQDQEIFVMVCRDILHVQEGSPVMLMFKHECIEGLVDLLPIDPSHIDFYEYRPTPTEANQDPTAKKLSAGHRNLLKWFIMWAASLKAKNDGNYLSYQQWKEVDPGDFNDFRLTTSNVATPTTRTRTGPTTLAAGPSSGRQHDAIADFKKRIPQSTQCSRTRSTGTTGIAPSSHKPVLTTSVKYST